MSSQAALDFDRTIETVWAAHRRELAAEDQRLASGKARILAALQTGPQTNVQLSQIALRFGGRIHELRHEDKYIIDADQLGGGLVLYTLIGGGA